MLVLSRKIGETVVLGEETYCTVLGVKGKQVRLGIDAPKATPINRQEIHDRIALENEDALYVDEDMTLDKPPIHELITELNHLSKRYQQLTNKIRKYQ